MKILVDLNHPVDINFFKNAINRLHKEEHEIVIIFRERGKLEVILKEELGNFNIFKVGVHHKSFFAKIFYQLVRDLSLVNFLKKNKIDLVICFGPTSAIAAKLAGIPYLAFDDDYEYKIPFYHANWFSTKHIYPDFIDFKNSKTSRYHGFKELAYLHPNYLKINDDILDKYGLVPNGYVFIREIASISLNYKTEDSLVDHLINKVKSKGLKIVLSLEDKTKKIKYKNNCIILEEPVKDLYSIMYHSLFSVSSGDTVARETALLGVPTIYLGGRIMSVNSALINAGVLTNTNDLTEIEAFINDINLSKKIESREIINKLLKEEWVDTTEVIISHVTELNKNEKT